MTSFLIYPFEFLGAAVVWALHLFRGPYAVKLSNEFRVRNFLVGLATFLVVALIIVRVAEAY